MYSINTSSPHPHPTSPHTLTITITPHHPHTPSPLEPIAATLNDREIHSEEIDEDDGVAIDDDIIDLSAYVPLIPSGSDSPWFIPI